VKVLRLVRFPFFLFSRGSLEEVSKYVERSRKVGRLTPSPVDLFRVFLSVEWKRLFYVHTLSAFFPRGSFFVRLLDSLSGSRRRDLT